MLTTLSLVAVAALTPQSIERPRDIWVFRSVLDKHARMLTIHLHEDLFVAYDATYCGLYQSWTGDVKLDGSVYTTVHGPQPTSEGHPYINNDPETTTWSVVAGGIKTAVKPIFKGYRLINNQVRLQYHVPVGNNKFATVYEIPEAIPGSNGQIGLSRTFTTANVPANTILTVGLTYRDLASSNAITTNGKFYPLSNQGDWSRGTLFLNSNSQTKVDMVFNHAMTSVQELPGDNPKPKPVVQQDVPSGREQGLSFRLYFIGEDLSEFKELVPGQTPNFSVKVATVDLNENSDYGQYLEYFIGVLTGFVNAPSAGTYEFRLFSDDGAKFSVNGTELGVNPGPRGLGDAPSGGPIELQAGENPIEIFWQQNAGGVGLRLEWKKPGDSEFSTVPASALTTPAGEVRVTAPGKKRIFGQVQTPYGDGRPLESVHPSFDLKTVRPESFQPKVGGIDFMSNGDMVICCWEPDGGVYRVSNYNGPQSQIQVKRIGFGLAEPLGIKVVDDEIYVLQKQELTQLIDHDGDGLIDEYKCIANGWGVTDNFHEFAFGLGYDNGKFYGNLATAINPGGASTYPQNMDRGHVIEIDKATGEYRLISRGLRTPNGIGRGPKGQMYLSDNQGDWLPVSKIMLLREGVFYGNRSVDPEGTKDLKDFPPVVWLPQNEIGNSPSQIAPLNVGPFKDQMVHGDVTHGGLKRVFVEVVDGVYQGVVFRMTQGLESGVNRVMLGPDGAYYVGGVGSSGNWGQAGKLPYGLQQLKYNGKLTFEMAEVHAKANGMEIHFTEPLAVGSGEVPAYYKVQQFTYVPTVEYGGPKVDEQDITVKSVSLSRDRKTAFLELDGLKEGYVVYIRTSPALKGRSGSPIWTTEAWYTLNKKPSAKGTVRPATHYPAPARMSEAERSQGFEALFDGRNLNGWKGYQTDERPKGWSVENGSMVYTPGVGGGDIVTKAQFGDFDLRFSWRISKGGNSGVMYRVTETERRPYMTGIEYQILDNIDGYDGRNPFTSAGSIYALYAPEFDVTKPVGEWNESRIVAQGNKVFHYVNGYLVASAEIGSEIWNAKIATSKFVEWPNFAKPRIGHIVFQDHGNPVAYRNIRIKKL